MRCEVGPTLDGIRNKMLDKLKTRLREAVLDEAAGILDAPLTQEDRAAACACLRALETETCPARMRALTRERLEAIDAKVRRGARPGGGA